MSFKIKETKENIITGLKALAKTGTLTEKEDNLYRFLYKKNVLISLHSESKSERKLATFLFKQYVKIMAEHAYRLYKTKTATNALCKKDFIAEITEITFKNQGNIYYTFQDSLNHILVQETKTLTA